jgi:hypothetical protein
VEVNVPLGVIVTEGVGLGVLDLEGVIVLEDVLDFEGVIVTEGVGLGVLDLVGLVVTVAVPVLEEVVV